MQLQLTLHLYLYSSGSLGSGTGNTSESFTVNATDPESAGNVTFELQSGTIPPGLSLSNSLQMVLQQILELQETDAVVSDTTYTFTVRAADAASNTSSRSFSITILAPTVEVFNASGTFSVPSGTQQLMC
jgi:hypothetical protein